MGRGVKKHTTTNPAAFKICVFLLGLAVVVLAGLTSFPRIASSLFFSWDSTAYIINAKESLDSGNFTGLIASYTQSFGNLAHPINYNLLPEVRFAYWDGQIHPVIMYVITSALFFVATFAIVMTTGFGPLTALISGLVMVLLTMPFTSPPIYTNSFWWDTPSWAHLIYMFAALFVTFRFIGRRGHIGNLLGLVLLCAEVMWVIVGPAKGGFVLIIGVGWFCLAMMMAAESRSELAWKTVSGFAVTLLILLTGSHEFIRGLYSYTGNLLFLPSLEAFKPFALLDSVFFFHRGLEWLEHARVGVRAYLGIPLTVLAILGAIWTAISPPTLMARRIAVAMLAFIPLLLYFIYGGVIAGGLYSVLSMFAVVFVVRCMRTVYVAAMNTIRSYPMNSLVSFHARWPGAFFINRWFAAVLILSIAFGLTVLASRYKQIGPHHWTYPPLRHPLIDRLDENIRFRSGDQFRGRYVDMSITKPMETGILPASDFLISGLIKTAYDHVIVYGNDLTIYGPRFFDIPVATEANRMNTPLSVLFHGFLLIEEGQKERVDFRNITHFDSKLFRLLGIRYVLNHRPLKDEFVRKIDVPNLPVDTALYEVSDINIGQYSPVVISLIPEWRNALETIASADFDPTRLAIVHDGWAGSGSLTPATNSRIVRTHDGYRITATSAGHSLLVLPFEFSRCLVVSDRLNTAQIGRTDFLLTGLRFEKILDTELRFRFGPFENSGCRLADMEDVRAMGLNAESFAQFRNKYPKRFDLGGVF
jgi:hypothetical protein